MVIDGKTIAQGILDSLTKRVVSLQEEGVTPHLGVVLLGDDESSKAYVRQKEIKIGQIGAAITIHRFKSDFTEDELLEVVEQLNNDPIVHGIIIQRPLPPHINRDIVTHTTLLEKDVDSFRDDSPFDPPVGLAVLRILKEVHRQSGDLSIQVEDWLKKQRICVVGKGYTAGMPTIKLFDKRDIPISVIDSKTFNRDDLIANADIIISAVGKPHVITKDQIKQGVVLIGVGMYRGEDGKMQGDYDEADIADKASFYTPVPGGVGPVNVAQLLSNLVLAAEHQS